MPRKLSSSDRAITEPVTRHPSDSAEPGAGEREFVAQREARLTELEERHSRERRELEELMTMAGGTLNLALREDSDVTRTRAALLRAAWVANSRAARGKPDPELVALRSALDRYLATRTAAERGARPASVTRTGERVVVATGIPDSEVPPLNGPKGGRERAATVRALLAEHVEPSVRYLDTSHRTIARTTMAFAEVHAATRAVVGAVCSHLVAQAAATGLGVRPIKTVAAEAFQEKLLGHLVSGRLTNVNALSGVLQAIGVERADAEQLTKRATS
jgi:hypothetical protein